jgi:LacI family transcriptional regulator
MQAARQIGLLFPLYFRFYAYEAVSGMVEYAAADRRLHFRDLRFARVEQIAALLAAARLDGLIVGLDSVEYAAVKPHLPRRKPLVNIHPDLLAPGIPTVCIAPQAVAQAVVEYFAGLGYASLGVFGKRGTNVYQDLVQHTALLARERGLRFGNHSVLLPDAVYPDGAKAPEPAVDEWLRRLPKPAGVVTTGGYSAIFLDRTAKRLGYDVPGDLAILSRSDDEICLFADPPISALRSLGKEIGHTALAVLDRTLRGAPHPGGRIVLPAPGIIERQSTGFPSGMDEGIRRAAAFIRAHACEGIAVADVLREVRILSRTRFYENFAKYFGRSPAAEILRLRTDAAKRQLERTNLSVGQIAEACGFTSHSQFTDTFRSKLGLSPLAWRRRNHSPD